MEYWDLLDENREPIGRTHIRGVPLDVGTYHLVCDIWVIDEGGRILLTQRDPMKKHGLKWECTGGSVIAGETSMEGVLRELREETGLVVSPSACMLIDTVCLPERFVDTYMVKTRVDPEKLILQEGEVVDAKLVTYEQMNAAYEAGEVVPSRIPRYRDKIAAFIRHSCAGQGSGSRRRQIFY